MKSLYVGTVELSGKGEHDFILKSWHSKMAHWRLRRDYPEEWTRYQFISQREHTLVPDLVRVSVAYIFVYFHHDEDAVEYMLRFA